VTGDHVASVHSILEYLAILLNLAFIIRFKMIFLFQRTCIITMDASGNFIQSSILLPAASGAFETVHGVASYSSLPSGPGWRKPLDQAVLIITYILIIYT